MLPSTEAQSARAALKTAEQHYEACANKAHIDLNLRLTVRLLLLLSRQIVHALDDIHDLQRRVASIECRREDQFLSENRGRKPKVKDA